MKKKVPSSQEGPKSPNNGWKMRFFGFWQKSSPFIFFVFYLVMKVLLVFQLSTKAACLGKIWFLRYVFKTSRPIRMQDSLNCNISQTSWDLNLSFCLWLTSIKQPIHSVISNESDGQAWACSMFRQNMSQLHFKDEVGFFH